MCNELDSNINVGAQKTSAKHSLDRGTRCFLGGRVLTELH
jgi:hypothetical protein